MLRMLPRKPEGRRGPLGVQEIGCGTLHLKAIGEIITIDTVEEKHRERPIDGRFVEHLSHIRQAWRKVNDGIVWHFTEHRRCGELDG
jgi:hypothetical protein